MIILIRIDIFSVVDFANSKLLFTRVKLWKLLQGLFCFNYNKIQQVDAEWVVPWFHSLQGRYRSQIHEELARKLQNLLSCPFSPRFNKDLIQSLWSNYNCMENTEALYKTYQPTRRFWDEKESRNQYQTRQCSCQQRKKKMTCLTHWLVSSNCTCFCVCGTHFMGK